MKKHTLFKFFTRRLSFSIGLTWLTFSLFAVLFELFNIAEDYPFPRAFLLSILKTPSFAIETLPIACIIGSTISMIKMTTDNEMIVLRNAGLSPTHIAFANAWATVSFSILYIIISEFVLPVSTTISRNLIDNSQIINGLWLRNNQDYIHIKHILPENGKMSDVTIYHTNDAILKEITLADQAIFTNGMWQLINVRTMTPVDNTFKKEHYANKSWEKFTLDPSSFSAFSEKPRYMSVTEAYHLSNNITAAGQGGEELQKIIFQRLLTLPALLLLSACGIWFIHSNRKNQRIALPVFIATIAGAIFIFIRDITIQMAFLSNTPHLLPLPLIMLLFLLFYGIRRQQ